MPSLTGDRVTVVWIPSVTRLFMPIQPVWELSPKLRRFMAGRGESCCIIRDTLPNGPAPAGEVRVSLLTPHRPTREGGDFFRVFWTRIALNPYLYTEGDSEVSRPISPGRAGQGESRTSLLKASNSLRFDTGTRLPAETLVSALQFNGRVL